MPNESLHQSGHANEGCSCFVSRARESRLVSCLFGEERNPWGDVVDWTPETWAAALAAIRERSSVAEILALYEGGAISGSEVLNGVWAQCHDRPPVAAEVAQALHDHPSEDARWTGGQLRRLLQQREEQIKRDSPLQPGTPLILSGGYTAAYSHPWWLNGRECYKATFITFAGRGTGKMPVALVELDGEIDLTESSGLRHKGRYALLRLLYVANWVETGTITVHVIDALPKDVEAFCSTHPFGTEIETHATYAIANGRGVAGRPGGVTEPAPPADRAACW